MNVILHADDFGFDADTVKATIKCFEDRVLSSASIMVNCSDFKTAIDFAHNHSEFSFGVHLTFVDELIPVSNPTEIQSLINDDGKFLESNIIRNKALSYKLNIKEIETEIEAQINKLRKSGMNISHLDSHGHMHKYPAFLSALKNIKEYYPNLKVRSVQNIYLSGHKSNSFPKTILNNLFRYYIRKNFISTDYFYMAANSFDKNWSKDIIKQMNLLPTNSIIEIGVHPGFSESWRKQEYEDIHEFADMVKFYNHNIINWNNL